MRNDRILLPALLLPVRGGCEPLASMHRQNRLTKELEKRCQAKTTFNY
jgi:hypothetical protein